MDTAVTEPILNGETAESEKAPRTVRPTMLVASAGLGAVMAAIVVLVWAFAAGPQSVKQPESDSKASLATAQPAALKPSDAPLPAPDASALPGGLPAGLPGMTPSGASAGGENPLAAFTPRPSVLSGGGGGPALPAAPTFPPPPDLQTVLDSVGPYMGSALMPSLVSGDAITAMIGNVGGWATAAAVATANNTTTLLSNLILASAVQGNNPLAIFTGGTSAAASLANIPAAMTNLANPAQALGGVASTLAVNLPALDVLSKLPAPQMPPIGLPPIGLPAPPPIGLPAPPPIGLPPIGLPPCRSFRRRPRSGCRHRRRRFFLPHWVSDPVASDHFIMS